MKSETIIGFVTLSAILTAHLLLWIAIYSSHSSFMKMGCHHLLQTWSRRYAKHSVDIVKHRLYISSVSLLFGILVAGMMYTVMQVNVLWSIITGWFAYIILYLLWPKTVTSFMYMHTRPQIQIWWQVYRCMQQYFVGGFLCGGLFAICFYLFVLRS